MATNTAAAKIPKIAITIRSSIRVKPLNILFWADMIIKVRFHLLSENTFYFLTKFSIRDFNYIVKREEYQKKPAKIRLQIDRKTNSQIFSLPYQYNQQDPYEIKSSLQVYLSAI